MSTQESVAFKAGQDAAKRKEKLKNSALKNLRVGCRQYEEFIAGYDSVKISSPAAPSSRAAAVPPV